VYIVGFDISVFEILVGYFNNCELQAFILRLSNLGFVISGISNCKLLYFGFPASVILLQQLLIASFNTSASELRIFSFNNY